MKRTKLVLSILMALMLQTNILWGASVADKPPTDNLIVGLSTFAEETFLPWNGGSDRVTYLGMINESLTYIDPKTDQPMPGLATKWERSPDGKTWTFWIRKGVQFHEGWGELTGEDVKYSLERQIDPKSIGPSAGTLRALIQKIEAPEPYKLVIYLKSPYAGLISGYMNDTLVAGEVACKKYVETVGEEKANAHPIGTGPYTLAEAHKKAGPIKLVTVPGVERHWRVTPEFKTVTFLLVPEDATRIAMLKTGEGDLAPISYDSIDTIKASGLHIVSIPKNWAPGVRLGGLVTTDPKRYKPDNPWAKKEVRQALNYAVDKQAIARNIFKGEAVPTGAEGAVSPWIDIPPYPYDPAKAKQLLAQAGYPNGFPITLKTFTRTPGVELPMVGEAVAMYWKAIGVDVKIVPSDWGSVRSEISGAKTTDYAWAWRTLTYIDPGTLLDLDVDPMGASCIYATPDSMDKLNKIRAELDIKKRDQLIKEFGLFMREEAPVVFLAFANQPWGASKKVGDWPTTSVYPTNIELITHP